MLNSSKVLLAASLAVAALASPALTCAQGYPDKALRLIIPNSPGTQTDSVSRIVANDMQKLLGQPIVVENRAGANGVVGYEYVVLQTPADGYTLIAVAPTSFASLPVVAKDLRFDPLKDFPPVIGLAEGRVILVTSAQLPWKSLQDVIAYSKANPGKLNYGEASFSGRVVIEAIVRANGTSATGITYKTSGQLYQSLATGEVHLGLSAMVFNDRFRILAVSGEKRFPALPDVPTFGELGFPEIPSAGVSFHVKVGTPQPIITKLYATGAKVLESPAMRAQLTKMDLEVMSDPPEVVARKLAQASSFYVSIAKKLGM